MYHLGVFMVHLFSRTVSMYFDNSWDFDKLTEDEVIDFVDKLPDSNPQFKKEYRGIALRLLEKDPQKRYSIEDLREWSKFRDEASFRNAQFKITELDKKPDIEEIVQLDDQELEEVDDETQTEDEKEE